MPVLLQKLSLMAKIRDFGLSC